MNETLCDCRELFRVRLPDQQGVEARNMNIEGRYDCNNPGSMNNLWKAMRLCHEFTTQTLRSKAILESSALKFFVSFHTYFYSLIPSVSTKAYIRAAYPRGDFGTFCGAPALKAGVCRSTLGNSKIYNDDCFY